MSRIFFLFLLFIAGLIRGPLSILFIIVKNAVKPLNKRIDFERKNFFQDECRSFKKDKILADYCFEVSSEGELEQVRPLIDLYLLQNKRIEILFASPSVENKCLKLVDLYKDQIRIMRLPVASFFPITFLFFQSPWSWVSAPIIIFCRYDFYPELLSFKFFGKKMILLSAAGKKPSWFKTQSILLFNLIVAANETEAQYFRKIVQNQKVFAFDFRVPRILERLEGAQTVLLAVNELSSYIGHLDSLGRTQKLILGSAWQSDLVICHNDQLIDDVLSGKMHLLIVPHNLGSESINQLKKSLHSLNSNISIYEITKGHSFDANILKVRPGIVILNLSGILCELYSKFRISYVGGGYERSIHSVLEPFLSGCQVICGPKINRSTEFDFIKELAPDEIHLLNNPESFYNLVKENLSKVRGTEIRTKLLKDAGICMESIIKEIESC